jgi:hypothetical protein
MGFQWSLDWGIAFTTRLVAYGLIQRYGRDLDLSATDISMVRKGPHVVWQAISDEDRLV